MKAGTTSRIEKDFESAALCFSAGYFDGALKYCRALGKHGSVGNKAAFQIAWLSSTYSGGLWHRQQERTQQATQMFLNLPGGQGVPELLLVRLKDRRLDVTREIRKLIDLALMQNGVTICWHPGAYLALGKYALSDMKDRELAIKLLCCAMSYRPAFAVLDHVESYARLAAEIGMPAYLWADWCASFDRHISVATLRPRIFANALTDEAAVEWAKKEDARSEDVVRGVIHIAPKPVSRMLAEYAIQNGHESLAEVIRTRFSDADQDGHPCDCQEIWWDEDTMRLRYFWYDMLAPDEKIILKNGEWAFCCLPTEDYSIAVAQWWRVLESVLKRLVIVPIADSFQKNPAWREWDEKNLSAKARKKAEIFIDKLAVPNQAKRLTLADILLVLQKCLADDSKKQDSDHGGSRLRLEASKYVARYRESFFPMIIHGHHSPNLRQENIDHFRNRSSHDGTLDLVQAATGRIVAKRLLDSLFGPDLSARGFVPTLIRA